MMFVYRIFMRQVRISRHVYPFCLIAENVIQWKCFKQWNGGNILNRREVFLKTAKIF